MLIGYKPSSSSLENDGILLNLIILMTKHYIYVNRFKEEPLSCTVLRRQIKNMNSCEKIYYMNKSKLNIYLKKWEPTINNL